MTKIQLREATIKKLDLGGYSKSLQKVMEKEMGWAMSLKYNRIIRSVQPALKEYDEDRNVILESVKIEKEDDEETRREKAKVAQKRIDVLNEEDVTVYEVRASELKKVFNKVSPKLLFGFADALIIDIELDDEDVEEVEPEDESS